MFDDRPSTADVLDRPVWHALTGCQRAFGIGDQKALRFAPEYGPFAAVADLSAANLAALGHLAGGGEIWLVEKTHVAIPPDLVMVRQAECVQMVATAVRPGKPAVHDVRTLGDADAADMLALALLTVPGPFSTGTYRLGTFIGIREKGRLIAMAGERMKPDPYTELSGVCTHPDHRGRGYAGFLMRIVAAGILERGERPFLHCYTSNVEAIALYESLGFRRHQSVMATVLKRARGCSTISS